MMDSFETLVRSLLLRPDQPAVLLLAHFSPQIHQTHGFAGPDHWHNVVAQFYDIPHISTRPPLFSQYMQDTASIKKYFVDPVLASPLGHELITDVLIAYFESQICATWGHVVNMSLDSTSDTDASDAQLFGGIGARKGVPEPDRVAQDANEEVVRVIADSEGSTSTSSDIPSGRMNTKPNAGKAYEEVTPYCASATDLINLLPPSLFYGSGWLPYHPADGANALQVTAHYWYSSLPGSKLRIPLQAGAGDIAIYYLQEPRTLVGEGSSVNCWVDDNYSGARLIKNAADIAESRPRYVILSLNGHIVSLSNPSD
jgi:hypothetical protein